MTRPGLAALALTSLALACGEGAGRGGDGGTADESSPDGSLGAQLDGSTDVVPPPGSAGSAAPDASAAAPGTSTPPGLRQQTNVSFDTAQRLEVDGPAWLQDERSADQVDYYVFHGEAGAFYEISTDRGTFTPDNVLVLYDARREPIAMNDDGGLWGGDRFDVRLVVRLPQSGDYYLQIEDPYTPAGFFASALPILFYHVEVRELTADVPGVAIARDDAEVEAAFTIDQVGDFAHVTLIAELGDGERSFAFEGKTDQVLVGHVLASGERGNGSTVAGGEVHVLDADDHAVARIDRALGQADFHPPLGAGSYHVSLSATDASSASAYQVIDLLMLPDNPMEAGDDDNDDRDSAEPIALEGSTRRRGLVLMRLPEGDEDFFAIDARADEMVSVLCEAESGGSGVRGLQAELLDDDGTLGSAAETIDANLQIAPTRVAQASTLYLRVFANGESDSTEVEPWARCAVDTGP